MPLSAADAAAGRRRHMSSSRASYATSLLGLLCTAAFDNRSAVGDWEGTRKSTNCLWPPWWAPPAEKWTDVADLAAGRRIHLAVVEAYRQ